MRLTARRSIALGSLLFAAAYLTQAARRPYYGGTLRVQMRAQIRSLDPREVPSDPAEAAAKALVCPLIYEPLVRFDDKGHAQPALAGNWSRNTGAWTFSLRAVLPGSERTSAITTPDSQPIEFILSERARISAAPVPSIQDGGLPAATGPFKIKSWDPARSLTLIPNERYWGARPYLDSIEFLFGRDLKDQALDQNLGKADVTETGDRVGRATTTLALVFENERVNANVRQALSLSADRATIQRVLAKNGQATAALLPMWLSGYSYVFSKDRDVARARQLAAGAAPITFSYDRQDALLRRIAERLAVNAMEAGIILRPVTGTADLKLALLPISYRDETASLSDLAALLKIKIPENAAPYEEERALLDDYRVIPVVHLPDAWSWGKRIHNWPDLANAWVDPQ